MPRIVEPTEQAIRLAAEQLAAGEVVAVPTETVYGLAADTMNARALQKVYEMKGRPENNPLIAHVRDRGDARLLVREWDDRADALAEAFWPGALTMILPKRNAVPSEATAGLDTIAVRSPAHDVARRVLHVFGRPFSAPSANRSGHISPTLAEHVAADFSDDEDLLILNGGASECGIESTVLDLTTRPACILRPGAFDADQIAAVLGEPVEAKQATEQSASPGTSLRHYAPRMPVAMIERARITARLGESDKPFVVLSIGPFSANPPHHVIEMPAEADAYATKLYVALRQAEAMSPAAILIESPPHTAGLWRAVHDRLARACHRA